MAWLERQLAGVGLLAFLFLCSGFDAASARGVITDGPANYQNFSFLGTIS